VLAVSAIPANDGLSANKSLELTAGCVTHDLGSNSNISSISQHNRICQPRSNSTLVVSLCKKGGDTYVFSKRTDEQNYS